MSRRRRRKPPTPPPPLTAATTEGNVPSWVVESLSEKLGMNVEKISKGLLTDPSLIHNLLLPQGGRSGLGDAESNRTGSAPDTAGGIGRTHDKIGAVNAGTFVQGPVDAPCLPNVHSSRRTSPERQSTLSSDLLNANMLRPSLSTRARIGTYPERYFRAPKLRGRPLNPETDSDLNFDCTGAASTKSPGRPNEDGNLMASETHGDFSSEEDVSDTDVTTGESYSLSDQQLQQSRIEAFYLSSCRARGTSPSQRALAAWFRPRLAFMCILLT